jgi:hypothetical protein
MVTKAQLIQDATAEGQSSIEAGMARSLDHAARLNSDIAAAAADGHAHVARALHEQLSGTYAFLAKLAAARRTVIAEGSRPPNRRSHSAGRLAQRDSSASRSAT